MKTQKTSFNLMLLFLFLCLSLKVHISLGADTISGNQTLSGDRTLISEHGNFELGFFKPGNSSKFYIGIWYKKVSVKTVVWVANREIPVNDKYSSHLRIQGRNLVLLNESQIVIWSTDVGSTSSGPLVAVLRDDGNFVLKEMSPSNLSNSNSGSPVWQSFDYPINTWLPGAKLSYNKTIGKRQILTSWKNSYDPTPGLYSLEWDPLVKQCVLWWNGSEQYFKSGPWNGHKFSSAPEMRLNYIYNYTYVDNENETYAIYTVYEPTAITRVILDTSGQIKILVWFENTKQWITYWTIPIQQCEVYSYCGAFGICNEKSSSSCNCLDGYKPKSDQEWNLNDFSGGCEREKSFKCESNSSAKGEKDKFRMYPQMRLPTTPQSVAVGIAAECESTCLSNCSCTAYAYDSNECSAWNGDLLNLKELLADDGSGRKIYIRFAASEFSSGKDSKGNSKGIVIGSAVGSVVVALVVLGLVLFVMQRLRSRMVVSGKTAGGSLLAFGYKDLQNATKNFSEKLGGGGFGVVFKGTLPDSTVIAVKKLESISQGEKQFRTEVSTIGTIQHVNLVGLRGFCSEGDKKLLVYEYLENSSLDSHLFHESNVLDWKTRYQIALGTARGLAYLHEKCREVIIHCDIKPENILLNAEFCPKVADFGLAKLMGRDFSRVLTTMRGTRGYLAPEWISGVAISAKADVYSYGMMLFEFISGRRNTENHMDGVVKFFPTWAARVIIDEDDVLSLLDPKLDRIADAEEVSRLCKLACWCVQDDENHRPSMGQVVQMLEGVLDVNLPPVPRSLLWFVDNQEPIVFFTEPSSNQSSATQTKNSSSSSSSKGSASSKY